MRSPLILAILLTGAISAPRASGATQTYVWWEAEEFEESNWAGAREGAGPFKPWDDVARSKLSGGKWITAGDRKGTTYFARYRIEAPETAEYDFYIRRLWHHGPFKFRFDDLPWTEIDRVDFLDEVGIVQYAPASWIPAGRVRLEAGPHVFEFELLRDEGAAGFDCFVLTKGVFHPRGRLKPGEKYGLAEEGKWAFEPGPDPFRDDCPIDLRSLNERQAGESGWVRLSPDGDGFVLGNGKPVRFWSVNTGVSRLAGTGYLEEHARHLAKIGVNMVRFHGALEPKEPGARITDVDEGELDRIFKLVGVMKKHGIYTTISPYWAVRPKVPESWGIPDATGKAPMGLLFWDETMQKGYKAWLRELFTRKNPYTGVPLKNDPAVAMLQIQNEDSLLFWTEQGIEGAQRARLGRRFGEFLRNEHGSLERASRRWEGAAVDGDDFANGDVGLYKMWSLIQPNRGGIARRVSDQISFYGRAMFDFNEDIEKFVRDEIGCPVLINAGNWRTANDVKLLDIERWSYTANEVTGNNKYFSPVHVNPAQPHEAGYLVKEGDCFVDASALNDWRSLPTNAKLVVGRPHIISESCWVPPVGWQSESPFLVAAYSSLNGLDSYYWFSLGSVRYDPDLTKWGVGVPAVMGGFPAAALAFRKGYIRQSDPVVHEERSLEDLWTKTAIVSEDPGFDPNRDAGDVPARSSVTGGVDPRAFLVGRVEVVYGGDPARNRASDLDPYIDEKAGTVRSATGELLLNHKTGYCALTAPKAKGITGFLSKAGGRFDLDGVTVESGNEYATVLVVSLDGEDLDRSRRVLVQVTTHCRPYGFKTVRAAFKGRGEAEFTGERIVKMGQPPWNIANTDVKLAVKNRCIRNATLLDENGYPVRAIEGKARRGTFSVTLPPNAMYVILE